MGGLMGFADVVQDAVEGSGPGDSRSRHPASRGIRTSLYVKGDDAHRCPTDGAGEREGLIRLQGCRR
jgi:hypothetical protein